MRATGWESLIDIIASAIADIADIASAIAGAIAEFSLFLPYRNSLRDAADKQNKLCKRNALEEHFTSSQMTSIHDAHK